jgi:holliday junction DNA helicase RuvA
MIGKLKGIIEDVFEEYLILDVVGVGYQIWASKSALANLRDADYTKTQVFFIETHVREDHIHLFGFPTIEEKNAFNILQTVNGVGAKVALSILSHLNPDEIQGAIDTKDKNIFCSISGIGPKLAERILLELKNKTISLVSKSHNVTVSNINTNIIDDASMALINLGINRNEAVALVKTILQNSPDLEVDQVIKIALQSRMK